MGGSGTAPRGGSQAPSTYGVESDERTATRSGLTPAGNTALLLAGAALVVWLVTDSDPTLIVTAGLVVAVATDAWLARRTVGPASIFVRGPLEAHAGDTSEWLVRVDGARGPVTLLAVLLGPPRAICVEPGHIGRIRLPPFALGVVRRLVFDLVTTGPVGLARAGVRHVVRATDPVPVGPKPLPLPVKWPRPRSVAFGLAEDAPRGDDLFRSVRPYIRGDEQRRVDWKSTAHHGELMVRESDGTGVALLQVVADLGPAPRPGAELIAGWVAYVTAEALGRGWVVDLVTLDAGPQPLRLRSLGQPFGLPPIVEPPRRVLVAPRVTRVHNEQAANRALATAGYGTPVVPRHPGLSCVVSEAGIEWR